MRPHHVDSELEFCTQILHSAHPSIVDFVIDGHDAGAYGREGIAMKRTLVTAKTSRRSHNPPNVDRLIVEVRGQKVLLDADLADVYGVTTKALNHAVKAQFGWFPNDFVFRLSEQETSELNRSHVTGSQKHRDPRFTPYAFTEHGAKHFRH